MLLLGLAAHNPNTGVGHERSRSPHQRYLFDGGTRLPWSLVTDDGADPARAHKFRDAVVEARNLLASGGTQSASNPAAPTVIRGQLPGPPARGSGWSGGLPQHAATDVPHESWLRPIHLCSPSWEAASAWCRKNRGPG